MTTHAGIGSCRPPLVLLPGLDGTGELFAPLVDALRGRLQTSVVRYEAERSFDDYVSTAARFVSHPNTVLVAESFSGPVALALCARGLANIKGVVLCATFARSPFRSMLRAAKFVPASLFQPNPMQPLMLRHVCLNGDGNRALLERAVSVLRSVPADRMHARLCELATIDVRPLLSHVRVPVHYLRASHDRVVGSALGRALTHGLSNVSIAEVRGPHLLFQSRPRECAEAILRFVTPSQPSPSVPTHRSTS